MLAEPVPQLAVAAPVLVGSPLAALTCHVVQAPAGRLAARLRPVQYPSQLYLLKEETGKKLLLGGIRARSRSTACMLGTPAPGGTSSSTARPRALI